MLENILLGMGAFTGYMGVGVLATMRYWYGRFRAESMRKLLTANTQLHYVDGRRTYRQHTLDEATSQYYKGSVIKDNGVVEISGHAHNVGWSFAAGMLWPLVWFVSGTVVLGGVIGNGMIRFAMASPRKSAAELEAEKRAQFVYTAELERKLRIGELD